VEETWGGEKFKREKKFLEEKFKLEGLKT